MPKSTSSNIIVRPARADDAARICEIYNPYVLSSAVTFEEVPLKAQDIIARMTSKPLLPWLVAEESQNIIAFASASQYSKRSAYRFSSTTSVYCSEKKLGLGVGTLIYQKLLQALTELNYVYAYAIIAHPNEASLKLHTKLGFETLVIDKNAGYKLGQWWDRMLLKKQLRPNSSPPLNPRQSL